MTNPSKAKGTRAEGEVLRWLIDVTHLPLHRNVLHGNRDFGDIGGLPGVVIEVKSGKPNMGKWLRELDVEQSNMGTRWAFLVWRTPGSTNPHEWVVIARPEHWLKPRFPIPGPMARLPYMVRRCSSFAHAGIAHVGANVGFRCDGFMPESVDDCHAIAMTGAAFETWLGDNIDPNAFEPIPLKDMAESTRVLGYDEFEGDS